MNTYNSKRTFRSSIIVIAFLITSMLIVLISCGSSSSSSGGTSDPSSTPPPVDNTITGIPTYTDISTPVNQAATPSSPQWTGETLGQTVSYSIVYVSGVDSSDVTIDASTGAISVTSATAFTGVYRVTATGTGDYEGTITVDVNITVIDDGPVTPTAITGTLSYTDKTGKVLEGFSRYTQASSTDVDILSPSWDGEVANQTVTYELFEYDVVLNAVITNEADLLPGVSIDATTGKITITADASYTEKDSGYYKVRATGTGDYSGEIWTSFSKFTITKYVPSP